MTTNENGPQALETPRDREDLAGGEASFTVPQSVDGSHEPEALFHGDKPLAIARPVPVQTSGRLEFAARCPECKTWHRHVGLGDKTGPCGATYRLEFKNKRAA